MATDLQTTIGTIRSRIQKLRAQNDKPNEQETKQRLITPMLRALGWDCEEADAVRLEYRYRPQDNPVDYALMLDGRPRLFIEAKALGHDLREHKWRAQTVNYANTAGVNWCVLTDGSSWLIYRSNAEGDLDRMLFLEICLCPPDGAQPPHEAPEVLSLLSQDNVRADKLGLRWQREERHRRETHTIRELLGGNDAGLVRLIRKHGSMTKLEALDLLHRTRVTVTPLGDAAPPQPPVSLQEPTKNDLPASSVRLLTLKEEKGITGQCNMVVTGKTVCYTVLKGSRAVAEVDAHIREAKPEHSIVKQRRKLVDEGALVQVGTHLEFTKDCSFKNPSAPAGIMLGRVADGYECWIDYQGRLLDGFRPTPKRARKKTDKSQ